MQNNIRQARQARGWNQRQLSEAAHTCQALISDLERGIRKPWLKVARRLSHALGVPIEKLFPEDFVRK